MASLTERKFSFTSTALAADTFSVVSFEGNEGLSVPYRFEVLLAAADREIDLDQVVNHPARFVIHRDGGDDVYFNGILCGFEQMQAVDAWAFYRATLVPRIWWLSLTHHNQVFLDNSVPEILEAVLKDGGFTGVDFELRLQADYAKRDYVCQYGETHLDFLTRWMTREGIYYYFEQSESAEKLIITDTVIAHGANRRGGVLTYSPASGLADAHRQEIVQAIVCHVALLPSKVRLRDYNYRKPSLEMTGSADVDANGRGEVYIYGEHFRTAEEGDRLAAIRAEALLCRRREFIGDSTVPYIQPGCTFSLKDHYRPNFNAGYLTVEMLHEGNQTGYLIAGLRQALSDREQGLYYRNRFTAIPAGVQFRPARTLNAPKITGTLNAHIDAAGDGQYAELDEQGRYKVLLPFDTSGRKGGKASAWLRMIQPYAGTDHGMHFPLHKGTEVLLTFIEGNPDRPIIAGAAPNPDTPSVVTSKSETPQCDIKTSGGNEINFQDQKGHERIVIKSPKEDSLIKLGDHLEDKHWYQRMGFDGIGTVGSLLSYKATAIKAGLGLAGLAFGHNDLGVEEGLELRTANGLKIGVLKKEQAIGGFTSPGYAATSITGVAQHSVKGYLEKSVLGFCDESTKGIHNFEVVGSYNESIMGWKKFLAGKKDTVVGVAQKVYGGLSKAASQVTKLAGKVAKLVGQKTEVVEDAIEMVEMKTELDGDETRMTGESTEMTGEKTVMDGERVRLTGAKTEMAGEEIEMVEMKTEMTGEKTQMDGEKTEISGEETKMSSESTQISGLVSIM